MMAGSASTELFVATSSRRAYHSPSIGWFQVRHPAVPPMDAHAGSAKQPGSLRLSLNLSYHLATGRTFCFRNGAVVSGNYTPLSKPVHATCGDTTNRRSDHQNRTKDSVGRSIAIVRFMQREVATFLLYRAVGSDPANGRCFCTHAQQSISRICIIHAARRSHFSAPPRGIPLRGQEIKRRVVTTKNTKMALVAAFIAAFATSA